ncbi:MAG: HAMP domain-containing protein [Anaerolineae bacterium]|nr:HAMP domain-containing protein [Anaerolineae bacterium]
MTIRFRIIIYYSSLLVAILGIFGAAVFGIMNWTMLNQTDADLREVLDSVLWQDGERPLAILDRNSDGQYELTVSVPELDEFRTPGIYVQIWETSGAHTLYSYSDNFSYTQPLDPGAVGHGKEQRSDVMIEGTRLRVITRPIKVGGAVVGSVQVATPLTTIDAATDRLLTIMLGGGVIALMISLMLGDWLARRVLVPVDSIVATAQSITAADDLERRIPYQGPQDELGRMVSAFNETLERLEKQFQAQKRFVADVSHELRTPLTTIQGNLDLTRLYGLDEKSMQAMEGEVRRMVRIVDDLLLLARADAGQLPMQLKTLDLDRLILEVYNEAVLLSRGVHHVKLNELDQVCVQGDEERLKQLFSNLIVNAIKYTPPGGTIEITLTKNHPEAQVAVTDSGIGIPPEDLQHIFDRFYRVDKARSRVAGGTGLGLSIAKWIADSHHGRIHVTSTPGKGSTFSVALPQAPATLENAPAPLLLYQRDPQL